MKQKLAARGLKSNIASLPTAGRDIPLTDAIAAAQRIVANAHALGQRYALNLGIYEEERWLDWCKVMREAAAFGQERGVKVVVKHHHGLNNTSLDLLAWAKQINHSNFGLFVDPGNIVDYTGKDAVKQTAIIASHVAGVVAKDCTAARYLEREAGAPPFGNAPSAPGNPEVMIQFGTGKVDFAGLFKTLKEAGFNGPVMVEGTAVGATLEETVANARANREYPGEDLREPLTRNPRIQACEVDPKLVPLLRAQCHGWIGGSGTPRRHQARGQRDQDQHGRRDGEGDAVERRDAKEQRGEQAGRSGCRHQAERETREREAQALTQHEPHQPAARCAKGSPYSDLATTFADVV